METLTLRQMAQRYASADGLGEVAQENLQTRLRGLSQRGLFHPVRSRGKAAEYDLPTVAAVRLALACADLGLDLYALRPLMNSLTEPFRPDLASAFLSSRIAEAVRRAGAGEEFSFAIELSRDPESGEPRPLHIFSFETRGSKRAQDALAGYFGDPYVVLTLPASKLISSILNGGER